MLKEYRISGEGKIETYDKAETAIARLREFEPPEGYWLAFSGGKDSIVIYDLALKAGVKFKAHFSLTSVDPPELIRFVKKYYPDVQLSVPRKTMWQLIVQNMMPPTGIVRYCCKELKERGGDGHLVVTGIRWAESVRRRKRRMSEQCIRGSKVYLHPIIDWSDEEVWDYIKANKLNYCSLYDEGFHRLGCIMCPMGTKIRRYRDAERWPSYYRAYLRAFEKMLEARKDSGKSTDERWQDAKGVMDWWIEQPPKLDPDQCSLFE